uniref:Proteasome assembly chaperone 4 n=1 Tax=Ficedula albicollis TaxID=59894 RepID=U3KK48_FICAL
PGEPCAELRVCSHTEGCLRSGRGLCLLGWEGKSGKRRRLAVAMCSPRDSIPVAASLLGDPSDTASSCLAQRLASKTKKQIFVSYNLQNTDSNFTLLIENRIKEEMTAFPDKF